MGWLRHDIAGVWLVAGSVIAFYAVQPAVAADYDEVYRAPRPPHVMAGMGAEDHRLLNPRCHVVAMPEANLFLDTARFRPTLVCMSRGLVADSLEPDPSYYYYSFGPRR